VGEANEGLRGGFLSGLEALSAGELVRCRLRAGSSMVCDLMDIAPREADEQAQTICSTPEVKASRDKLGESPRVLVG
jgi:hypothetical protein